MAWPTLVLCQFCAPWTAIQVGPDFNFNFIRKANRRTLSGVDKGSNRLSLAIGYRFAAASQGVASHGGLPDLACPWPAVADLAASIQQWFPCWAGFVLSEKNLKLEP